MEVHPGIFVSNTATKVWKPDPEVGGEMHVLVEDETAYVGMSRFRESPTWNAGCCQSGRRS